MDKKMYEIRVEPCQGGIRIVQQLPGREEHDVWVTPAQADLFCKWVQEAKEELESDDEE
jgi:hypothetical protein